jgi:hypothetical protein
MKKLALKLAILFIPLGLIIMIVNVRVDPANIFSGEKYLDKITAILVSGNNVDNIANYNERLLQKKVLFKQMQSPQVLVMGSSRIMEINSLFFSDKKMLNIGVSHANINDLIAITGVVDSLKLIPRQVIINVDPFLICKGDKGTGEWKSLFTFHDYFLNKNYGIRTAGSADETEQVFRKYYTMITFEYFKESIAFVMAGKNKEVYNVGKKPPAKYGRYADGSIAYSAAYTHPDTTLVADVSKRMSKEIIKDIDSVKLKYLNYLIDFFRKNKTEITIVKLPFHPDYFSGVNEKQNHVFDYYENFFDNWAIQKHLNIKGGFSARKLNISRANFYDAYHCSGNSIKAILN